MELASVVSIEPRPDFFGYVHGNTVAFARMGRDFLAGRRILRRAAVSRLPLVKDWQDVPIARRWHGRGAHGASFAVRLAS